MKLSLSFIFGWIFIPTTRKMFKVDWSGCKASSCCCRSCCSVVSCSCSCWWECWCSSEECGGGEHADFFFVALGFQNEGSDWLLQLWNCFQIMLWMMMTRWCLWRMIFFVGRRTDDLQYDDTPVRLFLSFSLKLLFFTWYYSYFIIIVGLGWSWDLSSLGGWNEGEEKQEALGMSWASIAARPPSHGSTKIIIGVHNMYTIEINRHPPRPLLTISISAIRRLSTFVDYSFHHFSSSSHI